MKHSELQVWQKAMDLVVDAYQFSRALPADERFGLITQIQRAAVSIPANIAEGHGRKSTQAYINHLSIAHGSLLEFETLIQIAERIGCVSSNEVKLLLDKTGEIGRMLNGLRASLTNKSLNPES
jgi:four helix bundle protein